MTNIPETGRNTRVQTRLVVIQILVLSLLGTLGGRLWYLQIRQGDEYAKKASGNHVQQVVQPAVRGSILDSRGVPLADNETRLVVSASRTELMKMKDDGDAVLTKLADVLGMKPQEVREKVRLCDAKTPQPCWNGSPYQPIPITDEATPKQALQIRERSEDFPGITAEPEAVRRYTAPGKANTAQVLAYPVDQSALQRTVHILVGDQRSKAAVGDIGGQAVQADQQAVALLRCQQPGPEQYPRVCLGRGDVIGRQHPVEMGRLAQRRKGVRRPVGEAATPQRAFVGAHIATPRAPRSTFWRDPLALSHQNVSLGIMWPGPAGRRSSMTNRARARSPSPTTGRTCRPRRRSRG